MFNLQANSFDISSGIRTDLDMQLFDTGLSVTAFNIMSFTYPEEIQAMINKNASTSMVGDLNRYQQVAMTEGITTGKVKGGGVASDMTGMMMGMTMANQMMQNMNNQNTQHSAHTGSDANTPSGSKPNFCPNCGTKTAAANFCPNCGQKLI
jgi:membrane protease subunit (stomatin/prohibitin family)